MNPRHLISWNVNGLRAILQKGFGEFLRGCGAEVVCLQEIKARPDQIEDMAWAEGWEVCWNPAQKPGYSGTATLSRVPVVSHHAGMGNPSHDAEGRILTTEFPGFYLVNVYVPNAQRELTRLTYRAKEWSPAFLGYLRDLERSKPVVVCGDMNVAHQEVDLARARENVGNAGFTAEERACFQEMLDAGWVDSFRHFHQNGGHYTWWSYQNQARPRNIGWRIDYFLVSQKLRPVMEGAAIHPEIMGSDHCPVSLRLAACRTCDQHQTAG